MTFTEWEAQHKAELKKVAEQKNIEYPDLLARMNYVWENGKESNGVHFEAQCPLFAEMDPKDDLFHLARSAYYHARQKK